MYVLLAGCPGKKAPQPAATPRYTDLLQCE